MLEFFGSDEKLDKAGIQMKAQDSLEFEHVSLMSNYPYLIYSYWFFGWKKNENIQITFTNHHIQVITMQCCLISSSIMYIFVHEI